MLHNIANLCPLMYGKSVFEARTILTMNGEYQFPEINEVCQMVEGRKAKEQEKVEEVSCYPNPSNGQITLSFPENKSEIEKVYEVEIRNSIGHLCFKQTYDNPLNDEQISLLHNATGVYFLSVQTNSETVLHKKLLLIK